jgi:glycerol uptake facilitator-like aquaporin
LKILIQQPRPREKSLAFESIRNTTENPISFSSLGMPSAHSQETAFSLIYLLCFTLSDKGSTHYQQLWYFIYGFTLVFIIVLWQRVTSKDHSIAQIGIGSLVGSILAFSSWTWGKQWLQN